MTDEQYYQMRNEEGDVRALVAEPALLPVLRRGRQWLRTALAPRHARPVGPRGRTDATHASGGGTGAPAL